MGISDYIVGEMTSLADSKQSAHLSKFFKTGKGEYGEGDKFLGLKVPVTRTIVKRYKDKINSEDIGELINSEWHEIRLAGFLLLLESYKKKLKSGNIVEAARTVDFYLQNIDKGNNWDLVDLVAPYILGDWTVKNPEQKKVLNELADMDGFLCVKECQLSPHLL